MPCCCHPPPAWVLWGLRPHQRLWVLAITWDGMGTGLCQCSCCDWPYTVLAEGSCPAAQSHTIGGRQGFALCPAWGGSPTSAVGIQPGPRLLCMMSPLAAGHGDVAPLLSPGQGWGQGLGVTAAVERSYRMERSGLHGSDPAASGRGWVRYAPGGRCPGVRRGACAAFAAASYHCFPSQSAPWCWCQ